MWWGLHPGHGVGWDVQEGRQGGRHCSFKRQGLSRKHCDLLLIVLWVAGALMTRGEQRRNEGVCWATIEAQGLLLVPSSISGPCGPPPLGSGGAQLLSVHRPWDQVGLLLGYSEAITNGLFILLFYRPTRRPTAVRTGKVRG